MPGAFMEQNQGMLFLGNGVCSLICARPSSIPNPATQQGGPSTRYRFVLQRGRTKYEHVAPLRWPHRGRCSCIWALWPKQGVQVFISRIVRRRSTGGVIDRGIRLHPLSAAPLAAGASPAPGSRPAAACTAPAGARGGPPPEPPPAASSAHTAKKRAVRRGSGMGHPSPKMCTDIYFAHCLSPLHSLLHKTKRAQR